MAKLKNPWDSDDQIDALDPQPRTPPLALAVDPVLQTIYQICLDLSDARVVLRVRLAEGVFSLQSYRMKPGTDLGAFVRRLKAVKAPLLAMLRAGEWKDADHVMLWPDDTFEDYIAKVQARGWSIKQGLVPPPGHDAREVYDGVASFHNVLLVSER